MAAGVYDFTIEQGATFTRTITVTSGGVAVPLTGYTARMKIRDNANRATVLVELTTENGRIAITGAAGKIDLLITDEDTAKLVFFTGTYDLEIEKTSTGVVTRLLKGNVTLDTENTV